LEETNESASRWERLSNEAAFGEVQVVTPAALAGNEAERFCTGDATDAEKFQSFARTMPKLLRNPLYHWSHLEMTRYFGVSDRLLSPSTQESIYRDANEVIARPDFSGRALMRRSNVEVVCTTDDPVDLLASHRAIAAAPGFATKVLPTWRPDRALGIHDPVTFRSWITVVTRHIVRI
jgi:glucuronate isomerase